MSVLRTLALGVVGFSLYATLRQRHRTRDPVVKAEPLQRWEGEGGHVPQAADVDDDGTRPLASMTPRSASRNALNQPPR